jgi:hypothetical protein
MTTSIKGSLRAALRWRHAAILLAVGLAVTAASACGSADPDGGFQLNPRGAAVGFSNYTAPGVPADFSGFIGPSSAGVTLLSAKLLSIPGFPVPRLMHVGVHLIGKYGDVSEANYWPPRLPPVKGKGPPVVIPVIQFHGYQLNRGRHPLLLIFYSFTGTHPGTAYYAAGLRITYRVRQSNYTGNWYAYGSSCVTTPWTLTITPRIRCSRAQANRAVSAYLRMRQQS